MKSAVPVEEAYRLINPGCVVLVTSAYRDRSNVMSLAWQTTLSKRPPLVGIAVAAGHFTSELINASEEFALNIPGADLLEKIVYCGKISGREGDKFKGAKLKPVAGKKVRAPLIDECLGHIECGVVDRYKTGDHYFFVGEVLAASAREDLFSDHWSEQADIIHHLGGKYFYSSGRRHEP